MNTLVNYLNLLYGSHNLFQFHLLIYAKLFLHCRHQILKVVCHLRVWWKQNTLDLGLLMSFFLRCLNILVLLMLFSFFFKCLNWYFGVVMLYWQRINLVYQFLF